MSKTKALFRRALSPANHEILSCLAEEPKPNWFQDALADPHVFFALRDQTIDAYAGGSRIYRIEFKGGKAIPATNLKYLFRQPGKQEVYVPIHESKFDYRYLTLPAMQVEYEPTLTLSEIQKAAQKYARKEAKGVHTLIQRDHSVIDVEASIRRQGDAEQNNRTSHDRIDIVRLEPSQRGCRLVFWEVKQFDNKDLFNDSLQEQIQRYEDRIQNQQNELAEAYKSVCEFQSKILQMRARHHASIFPDAGLHSVQLDEIARNAIELVVDPRPRIFVFGFNAEQRVGNWAKRLKILQGAPHRLQVFGFKKPIPGKLATLSGDKKGNGTISSQNPKNQHHDS